MRNFLPVFLLGWVFCLTGYSLSAQIEWKTLESELGFTMELPEELKIAKKDQLTTFKGWVDHTWVMDGSVGFIEKSYFHQFTYRYLEGDPGKEMRITEAHNPHLANRKGIPAFFQIEREDSSVEIEVYAELEANELILFTLTSWTVDDVDAAETFFWEIIKRIRLTKPQSYTPPAEETNLFVPLPYDGSLLPKVKGPLVKKVDHYAVDLPTTYDQKALELSPPSLAALPDGGFMLAYIDSSDNTHLLRYSKAFEPVGKEIVLNGLRCEALVGDKKGFAGFFVTGQQEWHEDYDHGYLIGFDPNGKQRFKTEVAGTEDVTKEDEVWIHIGINQSVMAYSGEDYAVYISCMKNWGDRGVHQGDYLRFYDENGKMLLNEYFSKPSPRGWSWGVSHSFSKALDWDGEAFTMMAVGDGHPRGFAYSRVPSRTPPSGFNRWTTENVWSIPGESGNNNVKRNQLGGLVASGTNAQVVFTSALNTHITSKAGYEYRRMQSMSLKEKSRVGRPNILSKAPELTSFNPKIVRYGKNNLVLWTEAEAITLYTSNSYKERYALFSPTGKLLQGPFDLPTWFTLEIPKANNQPNIYGNAYCGSQPIELSSGDLIWARMLLIGNRMEVIRIRK